MGGETIAHPKVSGARPNPEPAVLGAEQRNFWPFYPEQIDLSDALLGQENSGKFSQ